MHVRMVYILSFLLGLQPRFGDKPVSQAQPLALIDATGAISLTAPRLGRMMNSLGSELGKITNLYEHY